MAFPPPSIKRQAGDLISDPLEGMVQVLYSRRKCRKVYRGLPKGTPSDVGLTEVFIAGGLAQQTVHLGSHVIRVRPYGSRPLQGRPC